MDGDERQCVAGRKHRLCIVHGGGTATITHAATGTAASSTGKLLYSGTVTLPGAAGVPAAAQDIGSVEQARTVCRRYWNGYRWRWRAGVLTGVLSATGVASSGLVAVGVFGAVLSAVGRAVVSFGTELRQIISTNMIQKPVDYQLGGDQKAEEK